MANPDYAALLRAALDAQGVTDPETRAGMAAIAMGESNLMGYVERGYSHTSNDRIRQVFGSRVPADDGELNALKSNDELFFEHVYGPQSRTGMALGNTQPGDGFKFRGRYAIQITGRGNYQRYATKAGHPEVMDNPDLGITNPAIGMSICVAYIRDRYHGGGFDAMLRAVGNNTPDIEATKRRYFAQFLASGEFSQVGAVPIVIEPEPAPATPKPQPVPSPETPARAEADYSDVIAAIKTLQTAFKAHGWYSGAIDGDWQDGTEAAFQKWQEAQG